MSDDLTTRRLSPESIMSAYMTGDENGWWEENLHLWRTQSHAMRELADSIEVHGVHEPVLLGDDGRVWDGHHRILIAAGLGLKSIPVLLAEEMPNA